MYVVHAPTKDDTTWWNVSQQQRSAEIGILVEEAKRLQESVVEVVFTVVERTVQRFPLRQSD